MKMKKLCPFLVIAVIGVLVFAGKVNAVPFANPDPTRFGDDLDGSGIFMPSNTVFSIESFDIGGNTFGFFFENDITNLITIFDPTDQFDPNDPVPLPQVAQIDFSTGQVLDLDAGNTQDTFTPSLGNIGFFLDLNPILSAPTLFTVPSLNPGGLDVAGTFPLLGNPDAFLLGFFNGPNIPVLAFELVDGVTPVVPEPSTLILLGSGLVGLTLYGRKKRFKRLIRKR